MNPMDLFKTKPTLSPEQRTLLAVSLSEIVGYQEAGKDCYLIQGNAALHVSPKMDAEVEIANAIQGGILSAQEFQVTVTRPEGGSLFSGCEFTNNIDGDELNKAVAGIGIEAPDVFEQAESVVRRFLGEQALYVNSLEHHFFVYSDLIDNLPTNLGEDVVKRLVHPLVHRLECFHVVSSATKFLKRTGLSNDAIEALRVQPISPERLELWLDARCRESAESFIDRIGVAPQTIRNLKELSSLIDPCKAPGCNWATYTDYLKSLGKKCPREVIDETVIPLAKESTYHIKNEAIRTLYRLGYTKEGDAAEIESSYTASSLRSEEALKDKDATLKERVLGVPTKVACAIIHDLQRSEILENDITEVLVPLARGSQRPVLSSYAKTKLTTWALDYLI